MSEDTNNLNLEEQDNREENKSEPRKSERLVNKSQPSYRENRSYTRRTINTILESEFENNAEQEDNDQDSDHFNITEDNFNLNLEDTNLDTAIIDKTGNFISFNEEFNNVTDELSTLSLSEDTENKNKVIKIKEETENNKGSRNNSPENKNNIVSGLVKISQKYLSTLFTQDDSKETKKSPGKIIRIDTISEEIQNKKISEEKIREETKIISGETKIKEKISEEIKNNEKISEIIRNKEKISGETKREQNQRNRMEAKAKEYVSKTNETEKNRILDEISSDQFDEFMRHVIINTTDLNLKNKLENEYRKQKLTQRFALLGINSATRMDWSGFDERIPIWSGEQKFYKLADFIFNVENYVEQLKRRGYEITDEQIAYNIGNRLEPDKSASLHYSRYMRNKAKANQAPSWTTLKQFWQCVYDSPTEQLDLRSNLRRLKAGKNISAYNNEFMKVSSKIDDMTEIDLISSYLDGLDQNVATHIKLMNPKSLTEVMNQAKVRYEMSNEQPLSLNYSRPINNRNNQYQSSKFRPKSQYNQKQQFRDGRQQYQNKNYQSRQDTHHRPPPTYHQAARNNFNQNKYNQRNPRFSKPISRGCCYDCGDPGHHKAQCPRRNQKSLNMLDPIELEQDSNQNYNSNYEEKPEYHTMYTPLSNLSQATAPKTPKNQAPGPPKQIYSLVHLNPDKRDLMTVPITFDDNPAKNVSAVTAVVDTGCIITAASLSVAKRYRFQLEDTDIYTINANGGIEKADGIAKDVNIRLNDLVTTMDVLIVRNLPHDLLLGKDWTDTTDVFICTNRNTIRKGRRLVFSLNTLGVNGEIVGEEEENDDDIEGRLEEFMVAEDNLDDIGYAPDEVIPQTIPKTEIELDLNLTKLFEEEVVPLIMERGTPELGRYTGPDMIIEVTSEQPVRRKPFRRSQIEEDRVQEHVQKLIDQNVVEPSTSPHDALLFLTPKKTLDPFGFRCFRAILDYKPINKVIKPLGFPIPLIALILDMLAGYMIFSTLDLANGFFQCVLSPKSRPYTSFSTRYGHYQFTRCPQGIKTGPAWFSLCVDMAMRDCRGFALNYFDDIVIYSKTPDEHLQHIKKVMQCLKKWGFKIAPNKCKWMAREVEILGYVVTGTKVKISSNKIITIKNRAIPKNVKQVQQALGLFNFYRKFIPNFAEKSRCLYELIKKDVPFNFTEECVESYKYFINCITSEPALAMPVLGQPFIVYSDGSKFAIGGVLAQIINGVEHIIEYASRLLKNAELNYGISDIECLAVVFLIKKWHHFLYQNNFTLYTDHKSLEQLMNLRDFHGRLGRQALFIQEYMPFNIKYLPGPENSAADFASRPNKYVLLVETRSN